MDIEFRTDRDFALELDASDPLARFRPRFFLPQGKIYFDGNSLGLMSKDGEAALFRVVDEWKQRGIEAWTDIEEPWIDFAERVGARLAPLVGAEPEEVVATGSTTVNLHALVSTFYHPQGSRTKILGDELTFPSDIYALRSQVRLRGLDPETNLVLVRSDDGHRLDESRIIDAMTPEVAVAVLPSVLYRSGQLLDVARLSRAARDRGILIGFDCSHSVGVLPHRLDDWGVDFAFWCSYKYLNGGPGCPAFLYVNKRHVGREPGLAGWFGYRKDKQFEMLIDFEYERAAGGWQISSPGILGVAPIEGSLAVLHEAGIEAIREKSLKMTSYLIHLVDQRLPEERTGLRIVTPRKPEARGGHVALEHADLSPHVFDALARRGVVVDLRPTSVIRIAPSPLYNTFDEIWQVVEHLKEILGSIE